MSRKIAFDGPSHLGDRRSRSDLNVEIAKCSVTPEMMSLRDEESLRNSMGCLLSMLGGKVIRQIFTAIGNRRLSKAQQINLLHSSRLIC